MAATAEINGRKMYYDEDHGVWVWEDTKERVDTPYTKSAAIMMAAVTRWKTHNEAIVGTEKPLALETLIKEAMADVFVVVRDAFYGPSVTPSVYVTKVVNEAGGEQGTGEGSDVQGRSHEAGEGESTS